MKKKYIAVFLTFSLLNLLLVKDMKDRQMECERIHIDDIDRSKDVIPNEKAAIKIAELRLDRKIMSQFGLKKNLEYDILAVYEADLDEWCVSFMPKNAGITFDASATIWLSRYYGVMNDFQW